MSISNRDNLSRVYGDQTWRLYDVLDESLAPSGPDSLYDLAGDYLGAGSRVLDAGCRDAAHLIRLIELYGVTGIGVDPVEVHIARARAAIGDAGVADRADVFVGVLQELPFDDGHFDFVWCRDVVEQVDDLDGALHEVFRVLEPGGHMLLYTTFATDRLAAEEAELLAQHLGNVPANLIVATRPKRTCTGRSSSSSASCCRSSTSSGARARARRIASSAARRSTAARP